MINALFSFALEINCWSIIKCFNDMQNVFKFAAPISKCYRRPLILSKVITCIMVKWSVPKAGIKKMLIVVTKSLPINKQTTTTTTTTIYSALSFTASCLLGKGVKQC